jgi:hypothetical protein
MEKTVEFVITWGVSDQAVKDPSSVPLPSVMQLG